MSQLILYHMHGLTVCVHYRENKLIGHFCLKVLNLIKTDQRCSLETSSLDDPLEINLEGPQPLELFFCFGSSFVV